MGSKNKLSKHLIPIITSYITKDTKYYIEPFVGGANLIDKINHSNKIGYDIHKELIALHNYMKTDNILPVSITKQEYESVKSNKENYADWYVGLIGFCGSYNGKYFGGYAGECKTKDGIRHYDKEAIRNLETQRKNYNNITFHNKSFLDIDKDEIKNCVIYCDPPYKNTTNYKVNQFPYDEFYKWCIELSKDNVVLISEYDMPEEFNCIWEMKNKTTLDKNSRGDRIEKLYKVRDTHSALIKKQE